MVFNALSTWEVIPGSNKLYVNIKHHLQVAKNINFLEKVKDRFQGNITEQHHQEICLNFFPLISIKSEQYKEHVLKITNKQINKSYSLHGTQRGDFMRRKKKKKKRETRLPVTYLLYICFFFLVTPSTCGFDAHDHTVRTHEDRCFDQSREHRFC